jgi:hypothetical protein
MTEGVARAAGPVTRNPGLLAVAAIVILAGALSFQQWSGSVRWLPDSNFYEAHLLQLRGETKQQSEKEVFGSRQAQDCCRTFLPHSALSSAGYNPHWIAWSARFYQRRWLLPAVGATVYPIFGTHTLKDLSLLAYLLLGPALYLLLRMRFSVLVSLLVAAGVLLLPPLRYWSFQPLTDSWALVLEIAALGAAVTVVERGLRWLPLWIGLMLALSLTRDATVALVVAAAVVALLWRSRRAIWLVATGFAAALPAPLLLGAPARENLAYILDGYRIPSDTSLRFIAHRYPAETREALRLDLRYPFHQRMAPLVVAAVVVLLVGVVMLLLFAPRRDPYFALAGGSLIGGLLMLAPTFNYTGLRLELVFLPGAAIGVAILLERLLPRSSACGQPGSERGQEPRHARVNVARNRP